LRESDYLSASALNYKIGTTVIKQGSTTPLRITPKVEGKDAFLKDDLLITTTTGLYAETNQIAYIGT
jgi:hypothetical protein